MKEEALNPQRVTAKAMSCLSTADKEHVVFCQQSYVPLPGWLVQHINGTHIREVRISTVASN